MSNEAVNWAMAISTAKPSAKLVLLCLAYHHNGKTGRCDPTVRLLVEETGLSNVTVMTALTTLEASLLLEKRPGHGRSHNAYILKVKPLDLLKVKPSDLAEVQSQAISLSPEVQSQILEVQSQIGESSKSNSRSSKSNSRSAFNRGTGNNRNGTGNKQEDDEDKNAFFYFGKANGTYSPLQAEQLGELIDTYEDATVAAAITEATKANTGRRLTINFIEAIAKHFAEHGIGCKCRTAKDSKTTRAKEPAAYNYGQNLKDRAEAQERHLQRTGKSIPQWQLEPEDYAGLPAP